MNRPNQAVEAKALSVTFPVAAAVIVVHLCP